MKTRAWLLKKFTGNVINRYSIYNRTADTEKVGAGITRQGVAGMHRLQPHHDST
jgi:hypothetical protein